jgi:hypothetical protein
MGGLIPETGLRKLVKPRRGHTKLARDASPIFVRHAGFSAPNVFLFGSAEILCNRALWASRIV